MAALIRIDGFDVKSPTTYNIKYADIDSPNSGRSDSGYLTRERLRSEVVSIDLEWTGLTSSELSLILTRLRPVSFRVEYTYSTLLLGNEVSNRYKTATMYAGDKTITMMSYGGTSYWNLSVSIIEL